MEADVCGTKRSHSGEDQSKHSKKRCITQVQAVQSPEVADKNHVSQQRSLLSLPPEILEAVLKNLANVEIASLRAVCSQFNEVCQNILNSTFGHLRTTIQKHFHTIKGQMPRRESARRKHPLARKCDIIETLHMRLVLMQMTFGKHIDRKHCCFFAGEILDEILRIMQYVQITSMLARAYKVTDELFDLSTMAMEYFKEHIEPGLPEVTYFSSDFLVPKSPGGNSMLLSLGPSTSPQSTSSSPSHPPSPSVSSCSESSPQSSNHTTVCSQTSRIRRNVGILCRCLRKVNTDLAVVKREMRTYKAKVSHQSKQLMEYNSRLEQHDRKFEEQAKKMEALVKELSRFRTELETSRRVKEIVPQETPGQHNDQVDAARDDVAPRPQESKYVPGKDETVKDKKKDGAG